MHAFAREHTVEEQLEEFEGRRVSADIFQAEMMDLMESLEYVRAYIDDLLVVTRGTLEDHLEKLGEVLRRLCKAGLKVNRSGIRTAGFGARIPKGWMKGLKNIIQFVRKNRARGGYMLCVT